MKTCQPWNDDGLDTTWAYSPTTHPNAGLDQNYCRNPSSAAWLWCYTGYYDYGASTFQWENCDPLDNDHKKYIFEPFKVLDSSTVPPAFCTLGPCKEIKYTIEDYASITPIGRLQTDVFPDNEHQISLQNA